MRGSSSRVELILTSVLAACALIVTGLAVKREFFSPQLGPEPSVSEVANWRDYQVGRLTFGDTAGGVRAVVFSDFQCPFCQVLAVRLDSLVALNPGNLGIEFRHFPIRSLHPFAGLAAAAAECAATRGHFKSVHDSLFANAATLSSATIAGFLRLIAFDDSSEVEACLVSDTVRLNIRADSVAAARLRIAGTPTLLLNNVKLVGAPTVAMLDSVVKALLVSK